MTRIIKILIFLVGLTFWENGKADNVTSEEWKACAMEAQRGDADAQLKMGEMYRDGNFVEKNPTEAFYWFKKAASNGNGEAMFEVGRCFRDGDGVIADSRIAAENFWRAAEKGNAEGAYCYAEMLRDGVGVSQDKGKAYRWFSKAAEKDFSDSRQQAENLKRYASAGKTVKKKTVSEGNGKKNVASGKKHSLKRKSKRK